jgi:hypothetical protein
MPEAGQKLSLIFFIKRELTIKTVDNAAAMR